jgi:hemoglobin-like flavoprotein
MSSLKLVETTLYLQTLRIYNYTVDDKGKCSMVLIVGRIASIHALSIHLYDYCPGMLSVAHTHTQVGISSDHHQHVSYHLGELFLF